jgi:(1->4)-alpha-D-glucan 1-alpha-D-glucosylmutase
MLGSDLGRLTSLFVQICEQHRDQRDYTRHEVHEAIRTVIACFPVYRTYVKPGQEPASAADLNDIGAAVAAAKQERTDLDSRLFDFLQDVLTLRESEALEIEFTGRFQQTTAAVMAKGVEDTAFYCYFRLVALNEVGGDPSRFGTTLDAFHDWCRETQSRRPHTMLASSTHDTKRSEDVRARIALLSEVPSAWVEAVRRWSAANARYRSGEWPDRNSEYLLYQSLAGAWPISKERISAYMRKAIREAKEHTSWIAPNEAFEKAVDAFIDGLYADADFIRGLEEFLAPLIEPARATSLGFTLLKFTAPGVPDTYQGTELWDLSLVDPDNRRPVDYQLRRRLLTEMDSLSIEDILRRSEEGLPKLWIIRQCLRTRACRAASFGADGAYRALWAAGPKAAHLIAYQRGEDVIAAAQRLHMSLEDWGDTVLEIPEGQWSNRFTGEIFTGGKLQAAAILRRFPVALLVKGAEA